MIIHKKNRSRLILFIKRAYVQSTYLGSTKGKTDSAFVETDLTYSNLSYSSSKVLDGLHPKLALLKRFETLYHRSGASDGGGVGNVKIQSGAANSV